MKNFFCPNCKNDLHIMINGDSYDEKITAYLVIRNYPVRCLCGTQWNCFDLIKDGEMLDD